MNYLTSTPLSVYLNQIHTFLIKDVTTHVFSGLTMAMEDLLVNIAKDANFLKNERFDDDCKSQAAEIITVLEKNKQVYTLTYAFENDESCNKVIVYKKTPILHMEPGLKQLRKPNSISRGSLNINAKTNTIMSSFKTTSLNATLKFVKDESRFILQYPDMSVEQAEFVKHMITQCMIPTNGTDTGPGSKGLFDPLAEALKIFSLKYEFKLNNAVPTSFDMKRLFFEKIPKQTKNKAETDTDTIILSSSSEKSNKLQKIPPLSVLDQFAMKTFLQIKDFLTDTNDRLTFDNVTVMEEQFLSRWKSYMKPEFEIKFSKEVQDILREIAILIGSAKGKFSVCTTMEKISQTHRSVHLEKKWTNHPDNISRTWNIEQKPEKTVPIEKVNKVNAEVNNTPLNSIPIAKVNTVTTKENETHSNSNLMTKVNTTSSNAMPNAKVNTVTMKENETHSDFIPTNKVNNNTKVKIESVEINRTHLNSISTNVNKITPSNAIPNAMPNAKVKTEIVDLNKTHPNSVSINKVNNSTLFNSNLEDNVKAETVESKKTRLNQISINVNKVAFNSMPNAKVKTENSMKDENILANSMPQKHTESIELNNNTQLNSMPVGKVNTGITEDFIALRYTCGTNLSIKPLNKKTRSLITTVSEVDSTFARYAITTLKDFFSNPEETLSFKSLKREELDFLLRWEEVIKRVEVIRMFSIQGQMMLDELRTGVDMCSGKFKVVVACKTVSPINRTATFKKAYVKKKQPNPTLNPTLANAQTDKQTKESNDELPIRKPILSANSSKRNKANEKFFNSIEGVTENWIINTLNQLKDFLKDDLQGSLVVLNITPPQNYFLMEWQCVLSRDEVVKCFREDIQRILKDIHQATAQNANRFVVSFRITKTARNQTRDGTFIKFPCFPRLSSQKGQKQEIVNSTETMPNKTKPKSNGSKVELPDKSRRLRELENTLAEQNEPCDVGNRDKTLSGNDSSINLIPDKTRGLKEMENRLQSDVLRSIPKSASVTSLPVVKSNNEDNRRPKSANNKNDAKAKMIEALNQPLVSERGIKMMRSMGWDGGALGARGEGIVEPIALNLDMAKRAGLGSVKPPSNQLKSTTNNLPMHIELQRIPINPPRNEMKDIILQTIQKMLRCMTGVDVASEIILPAPFSLRIWRFVKLIVIACNTRKYSVDLPESQIIANILTILGKTDYIITACVGVSKRNILFVLSKDIYQPSEQDMRKWSAIQCAENVTKTRQVVPVDRSGDSTFVDGEAFRYYVMTLILQFCKKPLNKQERKLAMKRISKEIQLKGTLTQKQMSFMKDCIKRLNSSSRPSSDTEQVIFNEIVTVMTGYTLDVDFPVTTVEEENCDRTVYNSHKCIRLHKIFNTQQTTSTLDKPTGTADEINSLNELMIKTKISETNNNIEAKNITQKVKDDSKETKRTTVTNDTCGDIQDKPVSQNESMGSQIAPKDNQLDNKSASSQNASINSQNSTVDNQTTLIDSKIAKNNIQNEKTKDENKEKRRTTFTSDTFDERCMFDNQDASIDNQIAITHKQRPISSQNAAQNSCIDSQKPMGSQISSTNCQNTLVNSENELTDEYYLSMTNDCVCCVQKYGWAGAGLHKNGDKHIERHDKSITQKEKNIGKDNESDIEGNIHVGSSTPEITPDLPNTQNLNINELKSIIDDYINQKEFTEDKKKILTEFKENLFLQISENKCQKNYLDQNDKTLGKRLSSSPNKPLRIYKKFKNSKSLKNISITPKNYPESKITIKMAGEIQKSILDSIDYTQELPLLECHGIQDGALVYSCHTQKSFNLIDSLARSLHLQITEQESKKTCYKMTAKINSFIDENIYTIFDRLETYNIGLCTKDWTVLELKKTCDSFVILLEIDDSSFELILKENFTLYAGTDRIKFSFV